MRKYKVFIVAVAVILLISACSNKSDIYSDMISEFSKLNQSNTTAIDTNVGKSDALGQNSKLLYSLRNTTDEDGKEIETFLAELVTMKENFEEKPQIPEFFYDVYISAQDKSLETYEMRVLIDDRIGYMILKEMKYGDHKYAKDRYFNLNDNLKKSFGKILSRVKSEGDN